MKVKEVMNKAIAVDHDISLKQAAKIMSDKNIGSLIVVKGDNIIGIVTESDLLRNFSNPHKNVSAVMNKHVVTVDQEEDIDHAALLMAKHKIRRLPVAKGPKLLGIITSTDIIAHAEEIGDEFFFD